LYECKIWSVTLKENISLRVFETVELRGILKIEREGTMEGWRKLPNEELHNLHSSQNIIRVITSRRMR
jgi:hypothetical protein